MLAIGCRLQASGCRLSDFGDSGMEDGDWELVI